MTEAQATVEHWPVDASLDTARRAELAERLIRVDSEAFGIDMSPMWSRDGDALTGLSGLFLARLDGADIGFVAYRLWQVSGIGAILYLDAGGVSQRYRRQRVTYGMTGQALLRALRMNEFSPMIAACRTRHPAVLEALYSRMGPDHLFPFASSETRLRAAAIATAERLNPDQEFDQATGVIRGAYGKLGESLYDTPPRSDVKEIQDYFDAHLSEKAGDALLFTFDWDVGVLSRALYPQRSLGAWRHSGQGFVVFPWVTTDGDRPGVSVIEVAEDGTSSWADYE